jgi:glycosyltransferase involved in cell wall biosynthesis
VSGPLVTVICLCYNHERFVIEALKSVVSQTYPYVQLIIVDDASSDQSKRQIAGFINEHPKALFISHEKNLGNCKAFNSAFSLAQGEYIIDLAADDILLPRRLEEGLRGFVSHAENFGVEFGDAYLIDENGEDLGMHSHRFPAASIPQGDIYADLIRKYFICGASMMMRKKVLDQMGGYDESLKYEDFDLWIRSSRHWLYFYNSQPLVKHRLVKGGHHEKQFKRGSPDAWSTLAVCKKILSLNRTRGEQKALQSRLKYELRESFRRGDLRLAYEYGSLWRENLIWKANES